MDLLKINKLIQLADRLPADLRQELTQLLADIDSSDVLERIGEDIGRGLRRGLLNIEESNGGTQLR